MTEGGALFIRHGSTQAFRPQNSLLTSRSVESRSLKKPIEFVSSAKDEEGQSYYLKALQKGLWVLVLLNILIFLLTVFCRALVQDVGMGLGFLRLAVRARIRWYVVRYM